VVAAQQAPVILKLADLHTMTVRAQIPEADVIRLHPGQTAYFTILGAPDQRHYGKLRAIEPAPSSYAQSQSMGSSSAQGSNNAVFYNALFEVPNADGKLRIDMTAQVSFVLKSADNTLTIPVAALGDKGKDGLYPVRVLDAGDHVHVRKVRIGIDNNVKVQVLSGLKSGERVVVGDMPAGGGKAGGKESQA
ncbi:MAG TPA: HlyD family efflux transporter periplasmic adaptor subunit, partial [Oleiagrimonas sp.]|nr:HlyD family efflux transporter periplasmic adaptor subunit [Oleiagrimonas sp.]